ncbi:hypothetical protein F511_39563 [Dorcoceras hygrometricum]|uniref:Uncharacterized protein n=1 Tax=Dorcoceras hygrometricum TaxID=472368 RepID=A0A2Z7CYA8_9LAMI|nr:hypothetical protein F511_39563 [Dorcoceras hygrometricum]
MSLFDIQDVCIAIGSLATLDLPMVVDLIGIYGLKGPYRTLTTTNWFLQELSVIPRESWGDVARRSYHDSLGKSGIVITEPQWLLPTASCIPEPLRVTQVLDSRFPPLSSTSRRRRPLCVAAAAAPSPQPHATTALCASPPPPPRAAGKLFSANLDEENPSTPISSGLLVQADEGIPSPVVDLIDDIYRRLPHQQQIQPAEATKPAAEIPNHVKQNEVVEHYLQLVLNQRLDNQTTGLNIVGNLQKLQQATGTLTRATVTHKSLAVGQPAGTHTTRSHTSATPKLRRSNLSKRHLFIFDDLGLLQYRILIISGSAAVLDLIWFNYSIRSGSATVSDLVQLTVAQLIRLSSYCIVYVFISALITVCYRCSLLRSSSDLKVYAYYSDLVSFDWLSALLRSVAKLISSTLENSSYCTVYVFISALITVCYRCSLLRSSSDLKVYAHYSDLVSFDWLSTLLKSVQCYPLRNGLTTKLTVQSSSSTILVCYSIGFSSDLVQLQYWISSGSTTVSDLRSGSATVSDLVQLTAAQLIRLHEGSSYTSCTDPIQQPSATRTPSLNKCTLARNFFIFDDLGLIQYRILIRSGSAAVLDLIWFNYSIRSSSGTVSDLVQLTADQLIRLYILICRHRSSREEIWSRNELVMSFMASMCPGYILHMGSGFADIKLIVSGILVGYGWLQELAHRGRVTSSYCTVYVFISALITVCYRFSLLRSGSALTGYAHYSDLVSFDWLSALLRSGFPGFSAGRGFDPAGGAPGGG